MAGRRRIHPALDVGRGPLPKRLRTGPYGPGMRLPMGHVLDGLPPSPLEHKLATQHTEIQRLLSENQRLATTHIALRQELAGTQQELHRLQQAVGGVQAEKEQQLRGLLEKSAKLEADLHAIEPLKAELQKCQADAQTLILQRQDLSQQVQQITQILHRARTEGQQVPGLKSEIDALQQEVQQARLAFEYEKKANLELLEQRQAMEKNLVALAREVETFRAELTIVEKKARAGAYGGLPTGPDSSYPPLQQNAYGDSYGIGQMGAAVENGIPLGAGAMPAWGAYDMQRAGSRRSLG